MQKWKLILLEFAIEYSAVRLDAVSVYLHSIKINIKNKKCNDYIKKEWLN
jgi:hypothetical protein